MGMNVVLQSADRFQIVDSAPFNNGRLNRTTTIARINAGAVSIQHHEQWQSDTDTVSVVVRNGPPARIALRPAQVSRLFENARREVDRQHAAQPRSLFGIDWSQPR